MNTQISPIAQSILTIITESTKPGRSSYIAGWHICDKLGVSRTELGTSHDTTYDKALKELMDAGFIHELSNLRCRYQLWDGDMRTQGVDMESQDLSAVLRRLDAMDDIG
ncbi:MAG: hypothetical protein AUG51_22195 [Acidobacteria bacterium 13_1_20CM_3_53_8]|nr:MAG: hypothetical protein AUH05_05165 [Ktedonobacter sp. 13_2_20CM_53_11]OLE51618.1 MAG: hypothetical protein AUG51_22195 [Acidobacteria bacterium 13_1_20CM_3_53_8]